MSLFDWVKRAVGLVKTQANPHERPRESVPSQQTPPIPPIPVPPVPDRQTPPEVRQALSDGPPATEILTNEITEVRVENESAAIPESASPIESEGPPSHEEINRRRAIVRGFFNDYWSSIEDKPTSFAERLDGAESYINERVAADGENWRLGPVTRKQLGLPPSGNGKPR